MIQVMESELFKGQWTGRRLRRQVASLENDKAFLERRVRELESTPAQKITAPVPVAGEATPYVGLKALMTGYEASKPSAADADARPSLGTKIQE